ncbi:hypothetical protein BCF55_0990 [Hydrogenivirga caldilitoris]|uniref:Uncharacterized protein n=1 Tax=Hydrogenivirga caldilitoris TaxID=246264 RepID=A0A497XRI8_9AQUI|nr:hypothetical protein [Hydrogenivirga caldilitoris]RLJ70709.1 hypothetical protein BCF55_0990 [Hydrogenivirga caldilitoris]
MDIDKIKLDDFERQIEEELERGEWVEAKDAEKIKEELKEAAEAYLKKKAQNQKKER